MRYITIVFMFFYIVLESVTALLSSGIFFQATSQIDLQRIELLGYITSGLGISILINSKLPEKTPFIARALLFIACFFCITHSLHYAVKKTPDILPTSLKIRSVSAGVGLLNSPSPAWITSMYGLDLWPHAITAQDYAHFVSRHGSSEQQNRYMLAAGIRGIGIFSHHWDLAVARLDKKSLSVLFSTLHRGTYESHFLSQAKKPQIQLIWDYQRFAPPALLPEAQHALHQGRDWTFHEAAWWSLRSKFSFLPLQTPDFTDWLTTFNRHFTKNALENYGLADRAYQMPWLGEEKYGNVYMRVCEEIAPFLFQQGRPVLELSQLRDIQIRDLYVRELHQKLSPKLQRLMIEYQINNLMKLSSDKASWGNTVRKKPGDGLARLIWITPWLTLLSWSLLIINVINLVKKMNLSSLRVRTAELSTAIFLAALLCADALTASTLWTEHLLPALLLLGPTEPHLKIT